MEDLARVALAYFIAAFLHWWFAIVLGVMGAISVVEGLRDKKIPIPLWARIAFALAVLVIAQFLAYSDLRIESTRTEKQLTEEIKTLSGSSAAKDKRIAVLEERLENARQPIITPQVRPPQLEGLRFTEKQISSPHVGAPYGLSVTIQTDTTMQPTRLRVECDGVISRGNFSFSGGSVTMMRTSGVLQNQPNVFELSFEFPPFTPERPIIVTLFSARTIHARRVERVH